MCDMKFIVSVIQITSLHLALVNTWDTWMILYYCSKPSTIWRWHLLDIFEKQFGHRGAQLFSLICTLSLQINCKCRKTYHPFDATISWYRRNWNGWINDQFTKMNVHSACCKRNHAMSLHSPFSLLMGPITSLLTTLWFSYWKINTFLWDFCYLYLFGAAVQCKFQFYLRFKAFLCYLQCQIKQLTNTVLCFWISLIQKREKAIQYITRNFPIQSSIFLRVVHWKARSSSMTAETTAVWLNPFS